MKNKVIIYFFIVVIIFSIGVYSLEERHLTQQKKETYDRIIAYDVDELIKRKDRDALQILAKEGNHKAEIYFKEEEKQKRQEKAKIFFDTAHLLMTSKNIDKKDIDKIQINLSLASDYGHIQAMRTLARLSFLGALSKQDFSETKRQYERLLENTTLQEDIIEANGYLSFIYFLGLGVDKDYSKAIKYMKKVLTYPSSASSSKIIDFYQTLSSSGNKLASQFLKDLNLPIYSTDKIDNPIYLQKDFAERESKKNNPKAFYYLALIAFLEFRFDEAIEFARLSVKYGIDLESKKELLDKIRNYAKISTKAKIFAQELSENITQTQ